MKTHNLVQGSPEWLAYRAQHFNASDAPAMMGESAYKTRTQLLHEMHTGLTPDVDAATQRRFDDGHRFEALARPVAEQIIKELSPMFELYPVTGSEGRLSASFDGLTMDDAIIFEHKMLNAELRAAFDMIDTMAPEYRTLVGAAKLPAMYRIQMEQQLMLSGAGRCLFMASTWNKDDELIEERHTWYYSDHELRSAILQGWTQFAIDLENYVTVEVVTQPAANAVTALPAVSVQVSGAIAIRENFPAFEIALRDFIDHRLIRNPETDQDFADLESQIKALKNAEAALDAAEAQMLSQVETVDAAKRMKDMLHKLTRDNRLMAEKLLAARKDSIRAEIVQDGRNALSKHITALNTRIGRVLMPGVLVDFANAIKGKRTLDSMRDAVTTELARAKISANEIADKITLNLRAINEQPDFAFLFSDVATLALKEPEFVAMVIKNRIAEHQAKEAARLAAETTRIAEQERVKAEAAATARANAEIAAATAAAQAEAAKASAEAIAKAAQVAPVVQPTPMALPTPAVVVQAAVAMRDAQIDRDTGTTMRLGQISERLGFGLTFDFLRSLGFEPVGRERAAILYQESDFPRICQALVRHINHVNQGATA